MGRYILDIRDGVIGAKPVPLGGSSFLKALTFFY